MKIAIREIERHWKLYCLTCQIEAEDDIGITIYSLDTFLRNSDKIVDAVHLLRNIGLGIDFISYGDTLNIDFICNHQYHRLGVVKPGQMVFDEVKFDKEF